MPEAPDRHRCGDNSRVNDGQRGRGKKEEGARRVVGKICILQTHFSSFFNSTDPIHSFAVTYYFGKSLHPFPYT